MAQTLNAIMNSLPNKVQLWAALAAVFSVGVTAGGIGAMQKINPKLERSDSIFRSHLVDYDNLSRHVNIISDGQTKLICLLTDAKDMDGMAAARECGL